MRIWISTLIALLLLASAAPVGATSWVRLTQDQVLREAQILAIGRVSGALPARKDDHGGIYNDIIISVETYLDGTRGPAQLIVRLMGGKVCDGKGLCQEIAGGMDGQTMIGHRLLVAVRATSDGRSLMSVSGPFGLIRLDETGFLVIDQYQDANGRAAWEQFMEGAQKGQPDPTLDQPEVVVTERAPEPANDHRTVLVLGTSLLLAGSVWLWQRSRRAG